MLQLKVEPMLRATALARAASLDALNAGFCAIKSLVSHSHSLRVVIGQAVDSAGHLTSIFDCRQPKIR
jgi:hypothetical protein